MNVLIPAVIAALSPAVSAAVAHRVAERDVRWVGIVGAMTAMLAALLASVLAKGVAPLWSWGAFTLHFDAVAASLMVPMTLAMTAVMLAAPQRQVSRLFVSGGMGLLSAALCGVLANNALMLLVSELVGALVCAELFKGARRARVVTVFMTLVVLALGVAISGLGMGGVLLQPLSSLSFEGSTPLMVGTIAIVVASMVRLGLLPFTSWMSGGMTHEDGARALLAMLPFGGVAPLLYLVAPVLESQAHVAQHEAVSAVLVLSALAVGLSMVQHKLNRGFAFLLSSVSALIVAGALDSDQLGVVGAELLWASTLLGAAGFGLCVVLVMARVQDESLSALGGLAAAAPRLGVFFLALGAAMVGIPGTTGFVGAELILNGSVSHGLLPLFLMVGIICMQGLSVMRLFFRVFYGDPGDLATRLDLLRRERVALLGVTLLLIVGGLLPTMLPLLATPH